MLRQALAYIEEHQARFVQELLEFLSIPSVSAQPEHARDVHMAAFWLAEQLRHIGLRSEVLRTGGTRWSTPNGEDKTYMRQRC